MRVGARARDARGAQGALGEDPGASEASSRRLLPPQAAEGLRQVGKHVRGGAELLPARDERAGLANREAGEQRIHEAMRRTRARARSTCEVPARARRARRGNVQRSASRGARRHWVAKFERGARTLALLGGGAHRSHGNVEVAHIHVAAQLVDRDDHGVAHRLLGDLAAVVRLEEGSIAATGARLLVNSFWIFSDDLLIMDHAHARERKSAGRRAPQRPTSLPARPAPSRGSPEWK